LGFASQVQYWEIRPDGLRDVARRQMGIMLLGHSGVGMAKLGGDDAHGHAVHGKVGAVGVTQDVKVHRRHYPGPGASLFQRALLMRRPPGVIVSTEEDQKAYVIGWPMAYAPEFVDGKIKITQVALLAARDEDELSSGTAFGPADFKSLFDLSLLFAAMRDDAPGKFKSFVNKNC
jgi:hypothetical protein